MLLYTIRPYFAGLVRDGMVTVEFVLLLSLGWLTLFGAEVLRKKRKADEHGHSRISGKTGKY